MKKTLSIVAIVCLNMIFNIIPNYGKAIESSKSLCIYDARIRSIDEKKYVKEALLVDFEKVDLPESISLKNCFMVDNGEGNDKVAGDGIYTSTEIFSHNETMPFEKVGVPISKLEKPIVQPGFDKVRDG